MLEGEIDPDNLRNEGPFGEYTGYYTEELIKPIPKPALDVKRIYYRNNPILWETSVGRPVGDQHMLYAFTRNASLWTDLKKMEIPGIKSVYTMPEALGTLQGGRLRAADVSGPRGPGGAAVIASNTGTYGIKGVIIVDDDIDADDLPRVWWALGTRFNPHGAPRSSTGAGQRLSIRHSARMRTSSSPPGSSSMQRSLRMEDQADGDHAQ